MDMGCALKVIFAGVAGLLGLVGLAMTLCGGVFLFRSATVEPVKAASRELYASLTGWQVPASCLVIGLILCFGAIKLFTLAKK